MSDQERVVKLPDGTEVYIRDASLDVLTKADSMEAQAYNRALADGCKYEEEQIKIIQGRGIWDTDKQTEIAKLQKELDLLTTKLEGGGYSENEAREDAIRMAEIRNTFTILLADKIKYMSNTIEAKSRQARFDYMVSACAVYNDNRHNKTYFASYEDFLVQKNTVVANLIAKKCSEVLYKLQDLDDTPEKRFLKEFGFVDDQMRLINKDGHLVDLDGRLIDEEGRFVKYDKNGQKIFVDDKGKKIVEKTRKPFLDEDGKPIEPPKEEPKVAPEEKPKARGEKPAAE